MTHPLRPPSRGSYADARSDGRSFRKLLFGQSVSGFGVQLSVVAIPTFAIEYLNATASQVSILNMANWAPPLLLGLVAGHVADRLDRLGTMIAADVFSAAATIWLAYLIWSRDVSMTQLYVLVCVISVAGTFYLLGSQALVPRLLHGDARVKGNSHLEAAAAVSETLGQVVAARLIGIAAGALVVFLDGLTYLLRAFFILGIKRKGRRDGDGRLLPDQTGEYSGQSTWRILIERPEIVKLICAQGNINIGGAFILGFFYLYAYRELNLEPWHIALTLAVGNIFSFICAVILPRFAHSENLGFIGVFALFVAAVSIWLIFLAQWTNPFITLLVYQCFFSVATTAFSIVAATRRQHLTPIDYQGRIASFTVLFGYACLLAGGGLAAAAAPVLDLPVGIAVGCLLSSATIGWFVVPRVIGR